MKVQIASMRFARYIEEITCKRCMRARKSLILEIC